MLKLRTILLRNYPYYILLILVFLISFVRLIYPKRSIYNSLSNECIGKVINYELKDKTLKLTIKNKEQIIIYYYIDELYKNNIKLGDTVKVLGKFNKPKKNTTKNIFNYQKYLYNKNIFYLVNATNITIIEKNRNIFYEIKQYIKEKVEINAYLKAFILGDKSSIKKEVVTSYQENGISHLFAISGMHITLLSAILTSILKKIKIKEKMRYLLTSLFLILYIALIGLQPSALRGVLFFILFSINKVYYFYIKPSNIFIVVLAITLLINPYFIYDIGFQYSFIISLALILMSHTITGNYLQKLLKTSLVSFVISIPISLYNYYQINVLSIIYNLFYVPLVSCIIFPLTLLVFIFKPLLPVYKIFIFILENSSLIFYKITIGKLIFPKVANIIYLIYFIIIILIFIFHAKTKKIYILLSIMLYHYIYPYIQKQPYIKMLDVGQGDSILLHPNRESILIDTGGSSFYQSKNESKIVSTITIPLLRSLGIRKIKYLILTHGDADHMGEAINLVENFNVENVIFNCGDFNELEKELIEVLDNKKIQYYSCIKELNVDDNKLYFLNNKDYGNENDNSSVIYTELNNYKFLFMGDAGVEVEEDLIEKFNLQNIDVLKVGHHGSKTSSSKSFVDEINTKYSIISVGKNNGYGHPNKEVLNNLEDSKIYRTDQDGSILFKIKNDKLNIETCDP